MRDRLDISAATNKVRETTNSAGTNDTNDTNVRDAQKPNMRIGIGYDVHQLVRGRKLIIGGVHIEHDFGLGGHSDADVLCHAISDALLGAARLGDIGQHFPPTDDRFKDANSIELLKTVGQLVRDAGFEIADVDSVIVAQAPKMAPYRQQMRCNIADALQIGIENVGVKATTTEHLGFEGRSEGISAQAVAMLQTA